MPALGMKLDGLPTEEIPPLSAAIEEHGLDEVCSEVTEATRRLLAGETVTLHGEWVHLDEVTLHFPAYVSEVVARLGRPAHRITVFSWFSIDDSAGSARDRLRDKVASALTRTPCERSSATSANKGQLMTC